MLESKLKLVRDLYRLADLVHNLVAAVGSKNPLHQI